MTSELTDDLTLPDPFYVDSSDGVSLAVYDLGGDGPDIVFAHATGFCAGVFLPAIGHLGIGRVTALDFRGHGRSTAPETSMDWIGTAHDVKAAVDALGLERPFGVGHSMGGAALTLAEQASPGLFSGMWLFEPIIFPPALRSAEHDNPLVDGALRRRSTFENAHSAIENYSSKPPFNVLDPAALRAYVKYGFNENPDGTIALRCRPEVEAATYEGGARHPAFDHLASVNPPVTIARGAETPMTPASLAPLLAQELPNGHLEDHPTLGHFGPLQDPAAIADAIGAAVTAAGR